MDEQRLTPGLADKLASREAAVWFVQDHVLALGLEALRLAVPLHRFGLCEITADVTEFLSRRPVFCKQYDVISVR